MEGWAIGERRGFGNRTSEALADVCKEHQSDLMIPEHNPIEPNRYMPSSTEQTDQCKDNSFKNRLSEYFKPNHYRKVTSKQHIYALINFHAKAKLQAVTLVTRHSS